MKFYRVTLTAAVLLAAAAGSVSAQHLSREEIISGRNLVAVLKYLRPALLASEGGAGRIYYSTVCHVKDEGPALPFPRLQMHAPREKTGVRDVQQIFENDKSVKVFRDQSGMTRIIIGKPELAFLQTRIHLLKFTPEQQYTPELAVLAVEDPKEVDSAMHRLRLDIPVTVSSNGVTMPAKGLPHIPPSLKDVTIEEVFDLIAKTFGGVVFYGTCEDNNDTHLVTWRFAGARGVGEENQ